MSATSNVNLDYVNYITGWRIAYKNLSIESRRLKQLVKYMQRCCTAQRVLHTVPEPWPYAAAHVWILLATDLKVQQRNLLSVQKQLREMLALRAARKRTYWSSVKAARKENPYG